ncbi:MAG: adenosylcobalamin-dependent ribonucleoside-diphosphate reductase [Bacteroidia bacterium]|nr:MAG: adenosylcobalamin-dependent ribonucleoside-diphosphate reductase [Bacteroidia bacterium]
MAEKELSQKNQLFVGPELKKQKADVKKDLKPKQTFGLDEAFKASLKYFNGDELAARVWVNKYALKDSQGLIYERTPDDMHRRLASEIGRIELRYPNPLTEDELFELMQGFKYIVPQGSPMTGIGNNFQIASLSNCFVIGHQGDADSYGGIMKIDQEQVQLMKRRGGVGHDLSHIRPSGSPVLNSALSSTGVVPFMERYSNSTREVAQDGRRGALMLSISVKHPDAEHFIDAKLVAGKVTGANVSVKINDEFMKAVVEGTPYTQQYPIDSEKPSHTKEIDARTLWEKIVHNAWKSAEPGILFWDTVIRESVADSYSDQGFKSVSTNPCGEIPLCPYDSCRLLAINLYSYVEEPFTEKARFNWEKFKKHVGLAQRIMDDIIDLELEKVEAILDKIYADPEDEDIKRVEINLWENIKRKAIDGRRTGVGITAEGDMLAGLGLQYGSENAIDFSVEVHKTIALEAYRSSVNMAKERGPFGVFNFAKEKDNPFINRIGKEDPGLLEEMKQHGRRNISLLTIAPTGTTSLMTQTTSGIEPVFLPVYKRRRKVNPNDKDAKVTFIDEVGDSWEEYNVFHHNFLTWLKVNGMDPEEVKDFSDRDVEELVKRSPYHKATSKDVDWMKKVKMQGAIQKWVDHSISVTINLPSDAKEELVGELYVKAWESGCKGVTVYRDGSRSGVLLAADKKKGETQFPIRRPRKLDAEILRFKNNEEDWIAFIGLLDEKPYEIFTGRKEEDTFPIPSKVTKGQILKTKNEDGSKRYDFQYVDKYGYKVTMGGLSHQFNSEFWNYAKLISGVLRHGMPVVDAINLISSLRLDNESINTWSAGVVRSLKKYIPDGTKAKSGQQCEECSSNNLIYQEGCLICKDCGSSKCG